MKNETAPSNSTVCITNTTTIPPSLLNKYADLFFTRHTSTDVVRSILNDLDKHINILGKGKLKKVPDKNKLTNLLVENILNLADQSNIASTEQSVRYCEFYDQSGHIRKLKDREIKEFVLNHEYIEQAHELLTRILGNPEKYASIGIDDFSFTIELSKAVFAKMKDSHKKLKSLVDVKIKHGLGGELKHLYKRQWRYKFRDGGTIRFHFEPVEIEQSKGKNKRQSKDMRSARISFRYGELKEKSLKVFFKWLSSVSDGEYSTAIKDAYVTRVDLELNLYGLSPIFLLTDDTHQNVEYSKVFTNPEEHTFAESYDHGNRETSSHFHIYDVILKLVKHKCISIDTASLLSTLIKIERRILSSKDGNGGCKVVELDSLQSHFDRLAFYSPRIFKVLPESLAIKLARYKMCGVWKYLGKREARQLKKAINDTRNIINIDSDGIMLRYFIKLNKLKTLILFP